MSQPNKKSILIIDDEFQIRNDLSFTLENEQFEVSTAANKEDATEKLKESWDFILLDLRLKDTSDYGGMQLYKTAKEVYPDICIIILSAYPLDNQVKEEFKKVLELKSEDEEKFFKDIENHYISKIDEQNYIIATLNKLKNG